VHNTFEQEDLKRKNFFKHFKRNQLYSPTTPYPTGSAPPPPYSPPHSTVPTSTTTFTVTTTTTTPSPCPTTPSSSPSPSPHPQVPLQSQGDKYTLHY
jgi:hypothetical protein